MGEKVRVILTTPAAQLRFGAQGFEVVEVDALEVAPLLAMGVARPALAAAPKVAEVAATRTGSAKGKR